MSRTHRCSWPSNGSVPCHWRRTTAPRTRPRHPGGGSSSPTRPRDPWGHQPAIDCRVAAEAHAAPCSAAARGKCWQQEGGQGSNDCPAALAPVPTTPQFKEVIRDCRSLLLIEREGRVLMLQTMMQLQSSQRLPSRTNLNVQAPDASH